MPYRFVGDDETDLAKRHHECWPTPLGRYHMPSTWIDTDNRVWAEPVHLYTESHPSERTS